MIAGLERFWPKVLKGWCGEEVLFEFEAGGRHRDWQAQLIRVNGSGPIVRYEDGEARVCPWEELLAVEVVTADDRR